MDVTEFVSQLLPLFATVQRIRSVTYSAEGPIVRGSAVIEHDKVVRFYYNAVTGTTAFALIQSRQRVWGLDYDNRRGWHTHPLGAADTHVPVRPATLSQIVQELQDVLSELA